MRAQYETANPGQDGPDVAVVGALNDPALQPNTNGHGPSMDSAGRTNSKEEYGTGYDRPAMPTQALVNRPRTDSPAMATNDQAFHGLAHGMHGEEDARPENVRSNSRIV